MSQHSTHFLNFQFHHHPPLSLSLPFFPYSPFSLLSSVISFLFLFLSRFPFFPFLSLPHLLFRLFPFRFAPPPCFLRSILYRCSFLFSFPFSCYFVCFVFFVFLFFLSLFPFVSLFFSTVSFVLFPSFSLCFFFF